MKDKTGGPAFPQDAHDWSYFGITVRDYFAAKAMQSLIAGAVVRKETLFVRVFTFLFGGSRVFLAPNPDSVSNAAYQHADAMLAERDK